MSTPIAYYYYVEGNRIVFSMSTSSVLGTIPYTPTYIGSVAGNIKTRKIRKYLRSLTAIPPAPAPSHRS